MDIDASKFDKTGYVISSVKTENEGVYTCSSANEYGETEVVTKIDLVISR